MTHQRFKKIAGLWVIHCLILSFLLIPSMVVGQAESNLDTTYYSRASIRRALLKDPDTQPAVRTLVKHSRNHSNISIPFYVLGAGCAFIGGMSILTQSGDGATPFLLLGGGAVSIGIGAFHTNKAKTDLNSALKIYGGFP